MRYILIFLLLFFVSCNHTTSKPKVIVIQPFNGFSNELGQQILVKLKQIDSNILLEQPIPLPSSAFNPERNRYRADSLLRFLNKYKNSDTVVVGITNWDISTTKNKYADWGVMGLGYRPGNACVISTYRLEKSKIPEQFYKVVIHELGHTQGLPHCPNTTCFMRNANGGNLLDEETDFCASCKAYLKAKGWVLK